MKLGDFDLSNQDIVLSAGKLLGQNLMDEVKEEVMSMTQEHRVLFYAALLATPVGCMVASVGEQATLAILDVCKEQASGAGWKLRDSH